MSRAAFVPLYIETMRDRAFVRASAAAVGTWARTYACGLAERGRIAMCAAFTDREWLQCAGVTLAEVEQAVDAGLLLWDDGDLVIVGSNAVARKAS